MTPTLWGRASSVNVQKVMWALAECGIAHTRKDAGGKYGQTDTDAFGAMAPFRRVPVWQEEGLVIWESHTILRHLGRGDAAALWPADPSARARADLWMDVANTTLMPPFVGVFFEVVRFAEHERSPDRLKTHLGQLNATLDIFERQLSEQTWLAGPDFTLADIAAGALMYRYFDIGIDRPDRPALAAWYGRLTARPAYRATVMTSYDELRPT